MSLITLVCVVLASMSVVIEGNTFLRANPAQHVTERMSEQEIQTTLLAEIEASLGTGIAAKRIAEIQAVLRPMVKALPKNEHGNLDHVTVRYALHRVFVQRHGWSIKGLDPAGEGWNNASSPTSMLKDQVPSFIQNMFEQRLDGKGLGLHELAVFAATIEHLIHNEAVGRLGVALKVHSMLPIDLMTEEQADTVLDTYMMAYILGENLPKMTLKTVTYLSKQMNNIFLAWPETQEFVRKVTRNMTAALPKASGGDAQVDFATLVKVAETVGEQFGRFQDAECKGLKNALVKIEDRGSGRVRLSSFYKPAVAGQDNGWQFQESTAYLRQLGALDDSMADELRVMIPNYLISQTNCIASSDFYSVCCINECEDLMVQLEKSVAAPEAKPEEIVKLISGLPSSSVSASRTLSATLLTRLQDIAAQHGGMVQLHSRLFAQWMHHAYPRECPFPHVAGTTSSQAKPGTMDEAVASQEELDQFGSANATMEEVEDMHDLMMWTHEEELLVVRPPSMPAAHMVSPIGAQGAASIFLFACVASIAYGLVHSTLGTTKSAELPQKFMV